MSIADLRFEYNIGKRRLASYLPIRWSLPLCLFRACCIDKQVQ